MLVNEYKLYVSIQKGSKDAKSVYIWGSPFFMSRTDTQNGVEIIFNIIHGDEVDALNCIELERYLHQSQSFHACEGSSSTYTIQARGWFIITMKDNKTIEIVSLKNKSRTMIIFVSDLFLKASHKTYHFRQVFTSCEECSISHNNHDINTCDLTSKHACLEVRNWQFI